jgi:hypothetical protein
MIASIIITTIQPVTGAIRKFSDLFPEWPIILVGDRKTPLISDSENIHFISLEDQKKLGFSLTGLLPVNHYGDIQMNTYGQGAFL